MTLVFICFFGLLSSQLNLLMTILMGLTTQHFDQIKIDQRASCLTPKCSNTVRQIVRVTLTCIYRL